MSNYPGPSPTTPTFAVRNTVENGKEAALENLGGSESNAALREYCDKHYHQLLPIIAEKVHQEKAQQEKLKARLNFEKPSQHSESGASSKRRDLRKKIDARLVRNTVKSPEQRRERSISPRRGNPKRKTVFRRLEKGVFHRHRYKRSPSREDEELSESDNSRGGHWKSRFKKQRSNIEDDDLAQPWVSEDPEDHLKIFQAAAKVVRWAMPTWCHVFNSTLIGSARVWFDDLPPESMYSYNDLKEAFLANFRQQKKCIKDPIELHHIKQREGESTEDFVRRFKLESRDVKGAPEIMRISGFMHGITNPELIKRLHDNIPKSVDEMMKVSTSFLRGEVAAGNQERKKSLPPWKQQEAGHK
ncbi:reverse transcriptase domain-containing protein [Tanacetum coccineum]